VTSQPKKEGPGRGWRRATPMQSETSHVSPAYTALEYTNLPDFHRSFVNRFFNFG
jgi:hypothetical protein